jgi:multidrug efflux pump subunit AcrA (membrane-fusion protein)
VSWRRRAKLDGGGSELSAAKGGTVNGRRPMTWRRRRALVVGAVGVVVVGGVLGGRALADSSSQVSEFRTAIVKKASVSQTEQRSGIIEPVAQGTVAFPISGTITSVVVQPGQAVAAGQTLATLDTSALQAALTAQQASLAAAQLTLNNALNGQSSTPNGGSTNSSSNSSNSARTSAATTQVSSSRSSASSGTSGSLNGARQAVASGQQQVDGSLSTARAALGAASSSCASSGSSSGGNSQPTRPTTTTTGPTTTTTTAPSTTTTTAPAQSGAAQQCVSDLQASLDAQQEVAAAQSSLAQAESALDSLLSSATAPASAASSGPSAPSASSSGSASPSSAELVADQAAVDAAQADVTAAQQNLAQGTIVSPIDGTVAAVNMKAGDHVGAASSTEDIVVVGPGGYEVTTTVPVTDIGNVKLGQAASVLPDGAPAAVDGKVVSIGVIPTTSGSTTVYPVVIGLNGSPQGLRNGGGAAVTITLNHVADALTVPTSAVRSAAGGALHSVTVVSGSKTTTVPVQVGAVGPDLTQITSGLQEGQVVMLADLTATLPSNTTNRGLGGGFGGGSGFGGGGGLGGATIGRGG